MNRNLIFCLRWIRKTDLREDLGTCTFNSNLLTHKVKQYIWNIYKSYIRKKSQRPVIFTTLTFFADNQKEHYLPSTNLVLYFYMLGIVWKRKVLLGKLTYSVSGVCLDLDIGVIVNLSLWVQIKYCLCLELYADIYGGLTESFMLLHKM